MRTRADLRTSSGVICSCKFDRMQLDDDELRELYSKIGSVFDDDGNDDEYPSLCGLTVQ